MAFTFVNDSATITAAEYFLASDSTTKVDQTDDCLLQIWLDLTTIASTNTLVVKVYEKVNGGTQFEIERATVRGNQWPVWLSPSLIVGEGWEVSVEMTQGSDQTVGWSLRKVTGGLTFTNDSATIGTTEYFLASDSTTQTAQTTDCLLQPWIDFGALQAGDQYRVRIYEKVNGSGATQRVLDEAILTDAQPFDIWLHPAILVGEGWEVSVTKLAGTDRSIGWSLRKAA